MSGRHTVVDRSTIKIAAGLVVITLLTACGGGSSGGSPGPVATATPTPTPTSTATPTLAPIAVESGNEQNVNQGNIVARPLQVRLTTSTGAAAANIPVTFTGFLNAGLNLPDIVQTDASGIATWLPGYFNSPGVYAITASASGYGTVKFTVHVTQTPYQYDGFYHCRTSSSVIGQSFKVIVRNNQVADMQIVSALFSTVTASSAVIIPGTDILRFTLEGSGRSFGAEGPGRLEGAAHITFDADGSARPFGGFTMRRISDNALQDYGTFVCLRD